MRGGDNVRPGRMDLRVDGERRGVQRPDALDDLASIVDQQQVGHSDPAEVDTGPIDPEVVRQLRITRGDVTGQPFAQTQLAEDAVRAGQALLSVQPLLDDGPLRFGPRPGATDRGCDDVRPVPRTRLRASYARIRQHCDVFRAYAHLSAAPLDGFTVFSSQCSRARPASA